VPAPGEIRGRLIGGRQEVRKRRTGGGWEVRERHCLGAVTSE
jgi:hypothetical protein